MPTLHRSLPAAAVAAFCAASAFAQTTMTPLPGFGNNGWLAPGSSPYLSTANTERGLAYNPLTGNLLLVSRQSVGGVSNNVRILSGATGADLGGLDPTGIAGGTFPVNMVGVADDGAIYVGNLSTSATANFKVYKWFSEASGTVTPPIVAFDAPSGVVRTGDAFAVNGGLASPAIFAAAGSSTASNSNFVVGTLDSTNTVTAFLSIAGTAMASNDYRLGLTFVDPTTVIGNQGTTARLTTFDTGTATATVTASIPLGGVARRPLDYAVIAGVPVLAVLDNNSSVVTVFDITNPFAPLQLASATTTSGTLVANANATGSVAWGPISGTSAVLYAMSSNQGVQAFQLNLGPAAGVTAYGIGCDGLGTASTGLPSLGNSGFAIDATNVPVVSPVAFIAFGVSVVNPGIDLTGLGMPGCFSYTSFDLGMFTTLPVVAGTGSFPLPIPLNSALAGTSLATQSVSLSLATPLSLAAGNGLQFVIGF